MWAWLLRHALSIHIVKGVVRRGAKRDRYSYHMGLGWAGQHYVGSRGRLIGQFGWGEGGGGERFEFEDGGGVSFVFFLLVNGSVSLNETIKD